MKVKYLREVPYSKLDLGELHLLKEDIRELIRERNEPIFKVSININKKKEEGRTTIARIILVKKR